MTALETALERYFAAEDAILADMQARRKAARAGEAIRNTLTPHDSPPAVENPQPDAGRGVGVRHYTSAPSAAALPSEGAARWQGEGQRPGSPPFARLLGLVLGMACALAVFGLAQIVAPAWNPFAPSETGESL